MRIHHTEAGEGPPVVLVHGWGVDAKRNWIDTGWVAKLATDRRVIAIDSRGHGASDKPHDQKLYGYRALSEDVLQVLDELSIDTADLIGYSMGSFIGVSLLGHHPDRFTSMVLGGIGDETPASADACLVIAEALRAADPSDITDPIGRAYRAFIDADPTSDREALALAALEMWPDGHPLELGGTGLGDADVPVLIVNGANDHPYVDTVDPLVRALRHAELVVVPDADHLTLVSDPRFLQAAIAFLREPGRPSGQQRRDRPTRAPHEETT